MPSFVIVSPSYEKFRVRVADCTREHADSVLQQLLVEPTVPSDLFMVEEKPHTPEPQAKRRWWRPWR